jgi:hypothetical protein
LQARLETDTCFRELLSGANLCLDDLGFHLADRTATFEALLCSFLHNLIHYVLIMILEMQGHEQKTAFVLLGYNDDFTEQPPSKVLLWSLLCKSHTLCIDPKLWKCRDMCRQLDLCLLEILMK